MESDMKRYSKEELKNLGYEALSMDEEGAKKREYRLVECDEKSLHDFLFDDVPFDYEDERGIPFAYHVEKPLPIDPFELVEYLQSLDDEREMKDFILRAKQRFAGRRLFDVDLRDGAYLEDIYFKLPEHRVSHVLSLLEYHEARDYLVDAGRLASFLVELADKDDEREEDELYSPGYSDYALGIILRNMGHSFYLMETQAKDVAEADLSYYQENLKILAGHGDFQGMRLLGYEYYEGSNGFPYDPKLSLHYLSAAFALRDDPDIARTLGYIYYYGRANNGVPDGDKAFQYFAIGHIAGRYFEATYKLADCYIKGYGTPVSHQAAYNLVASIYAETRDLYLDGEDYSKFADVALRLGSYYRDGIYVEKDNYEALGQFLLARAAIKSRLEAGEYIGDRSVAASISENIASVVNDLNLQKREFSEYGLVLPNYEGHFADAEVEIERVDERHIKVNFVPTKKFAYFLLSHQACFAERMTEITFMLRMDNPMDEEALERLQNLEPNDLYFDGDAVTFANTKKDDWLYQSIDEVSLLPGEGLGFYTKHCLVKVRFDDDEKTYDYLCLDREVRQGDLLTVESQGQSKRVNAVDVRYVYEDELPLPLSKMGMAKKVRFA